MIKYLVIFAFLFPEITFAQSAEDSVKAVINKMFLALQVGNGSILRECFTDSAILQTISTKNGVVIATTPIEKFVQQVNGLERGAADERIRFESIRWDGDLASVWTPYEFYFKGKFSHCGANSFQLVRINGTWLIHYLIDTRRKESCF